MREILFRGKPVTGERYFVEGGAIQGVAHELWQNSDRVYIMVFPKYLPKPKLYEVIPETVGQYTGLTDKNGKRIFEGDVIECWSEGVKARGTVQQNMGGLWIIYPAWQKRIMWGLCPNEDGSTDVEIIGNIHDNPELMKEEPT